MVDVALRRHSGVRSVLWLKYIHCANMLHRVSQSLLESMTGIYDGVRRRALPVLYKALDPGTEDDRMKGALWTLNYPSFGRYAIGEPKLAAILLPILLRCQHNEKVSKRATFGTDEAHSVAALHSRLRIGSNGELYVNTAFSRARD